MKHTEIEKLFELDLDDEIFYRRTFKDMDEYVFKYEIPGRSGVCEFTRTLRQNIESRKINCIGCQISKPNKGTLEYRIKENIANKFNELILNSLISTDNILLHQDNNADNIYSKIIELGRRHCYTSREIGMSLSKKDETITYGIPSSLDYTHMYSIRGTKIYTRWHEDRDILYLFNGIEYDIKFMGLDKSDIDDTYTLSYKYKFKPRDLVTVYYDNNGSIINIYNEVAIPYMRDKISNDIINQ